MSTRVAVVGSYNVGLTVQSPRMPAMGETVLGESFLEGPGGKGSNQAVAAARLGAEVHFLGCVGRDRYGDDALELWDREDVYAHVRRDSEHTGVGVIVVFPDGENAIIVAPGANASLSPNDVDGMEETIASCHVLLLQLETPVATALQAAKVAHAHGLRVVLNPAPAQPLPEELFRYVSVLTPNESEAHVLLGEAPDAGLEPGELVRRLSDLGADTVVLTQGKAGVTVGHPDGIEQVATPTIEAVDPTGAGDAFNGALAVALAEGRSVLEASRWAAHAGAYCATHMEVIPGLPARNELEQFIEKHAS